MAYKQHANNNIQITHKQHTNTTPHHHRNKSTPPNAHKQHQNITKTKYFIMKFMMASSGHFEEDECFAA